MAYTPSNQHQTNKNQTYGVKISTKDSSGIEGLNYKHIRKQELNKDVLCLLIHVVDGNNFLLFHH